MNERKLKQLFAAARNESAPAPPADFAADVLRAVRREPPAAPQTSALPDPLNRLFPRVALAAAAIIIMCAAADYAMTVAGVPGVGDGVSQLSAQWLLSPEGI